MVGVSSVNQMAKQYALNPTAWKPAQYMAFGEIRTSSGFSTDSDEPRLRVWDVVDNENGKYITEDRRNIKIVLVMMKKKFMKAQGEMAFRSKCESCRGDVETNANRLYRRYHWTSECREGE